LPRISGDAFTKVDAILTPTSPVPRLNGGAHDDPLQMYLADIYTVTDRWRGFRDLRACGKIGGKLPVGLQIFGAPFGEARVLATGSRLRASWGATVLIFRERACVKACDQSRTIIENLASRAKANCCVRRARSLPPMEDDAR